MNIELTQSTGKLIKDPQLLDVNYLPEEMVGRKEILRTTVSDLVQMPSSHLLLYGSHGCGRHIFAVHIQKMLKYHVEQSGKKFLFATVDCSKHRTTPQIMSEIVRQIDPDNHYIKGKKGFMILFLF
ncbi:MAG: archaeal cell division control protein 6 [Methanolobus sp.]|jgi:Cdc6-like AAA superfamily ATPase|nr:archaeal cell division control protein 6 [Methanolobus sp.]